MDQRTALVTARFAGTDASEKNYLKRISDGVEKLAKAADKIASEQG